MLTRFKTADIVGMAQLIKEYLKGEEFRDQRKIYYFYNKGEYNCVIRAADKYYEKYGVQNKNFELLLYKAAAQEVLDDIRGAISTYEIALPFIERLDNVQQGRFAFVYFNLGQLHYDEGNLEKSVSHIKYGLLLEPQRVYYQIFLGEMYKKMGNLDVALSHFLEILDSPQLTEEERVVIEMKISHLPDSHQTWSIESIDSGELFVHEGFMLKVQPINGYDPSIDIDAICLLLTSKYRLGCEVLPPLELPEEKIYEKDREQYNADRILEELTGLYPPKKKRAYIVLAITGKDIYGGESNFVFSWQSGAIGIGVVSSYQFIEYLDDFYEKETISTRRVGIQFLSTAGSILGFKRASKPHCPLAYPNGLDAFLQKGSKLCRSTIKQLDDGLDKWGGSRQAIDRKMAQQIQKVHQTYYWQFR